MFTLVEVTKEDFIENITDFPDDKFAKTFVAKANYQQMWDKCVGIEENGELLGAIIVTISKNKPHCANLQLLHTFAKYRRRGVASHLVHYALHHALKHAAAYFRVSSEVEAVPFYKACGFTFLGIQKSGTYLSICKLVEGVDAFDECDYTVDDYISKKMKSKRGGVVKELTHE